MTKRTLFGTKLKRTHVSGFRKRISTKHGRNIIRARRQKQRANITLKLYYTT
jgi:ribosomal protein L34